MNSNAILTAILILPLFSLPLRGQEPDRTRFEALDVFELEFASDTRLAPDGETVVYVRRSQDIMTDRSHSSLWMLRVDGSGHRPLTADQHGNSSPRWSPDGKRLLFISNRGGTPQLIVRWMDSGVEAPITHLASTPSAPSWSPDGEWVAFLQFVEEAQTPLAALPEKPEGAQWAPAAKVITQLTYRADGEGYLSQGHTQLFVVPAAGGTARQVTSGPFDVEGEPQWTPDGRSLIFSSNRRADAEYEPLDTGLFAVPLEGGVPQALSERYGPERSPRVSPSGKHIAYLGFDDTHQGFQVTELYVCERDGSRPRSLTSGLDRSVLSVQWATDEDGLFFSYSDQGDTKVAFVALDTGAMRPLFGSLGGTTLGRPYSSGSFFALASGRLDQGLIIYTHTESNRPADLYVYDLGDDSLQQLTDLNGDSLGFKSLPVAEELRFESSFDGMALQGWLLKPPGFDPNRNYPLILEIHGGPFANYGPRFSAECQLYAAAGYVVFYMNPRGSTSYGARFGNAIHHAYPGHDYDDLMSGVDRVLALGYVDRERLFVTGGSGGGVLTAWIVGQTDRFRAAVVAKPVINWTSFALTADAYNFFHRYWFGGFPWDQQEQYWKRSPLSLVGNVKTPTMLISGEVDYRTPISEAEQFYQALKLRAVEAALVRIPGASHGIAARPSHLISKVAHILAWFDKHGGRQSD